MSDRDWTSRLNDVMPFGSSTCSKAPALAPDEPGVIVRGQGCRVWDDRGREFIDFRNGLGPITLGYRFPAVEEAIRKQLESGIIFGHPHPLECEVAEMLREIIPCAEQVRFLKTGGEAIAACIRLARAYTSRDHVIQIGYNGWINSLSSSGRVLPGQEATSVPPGVPGQLSALHHTCGWNDVTTLEKIFDAHDKQIAAVIVAADYRNMSAGKTFYPALREITKRHGAVLIYDEIVTGFRIAKAGTQEYFSSPSPGTPGEGRGEGDFGSSVKAPSPQPSPGVPGEGADVIPDLAVYAKGIANGMPLSAYCGSRELMQTAKRAVISTTYGGETLSLAAAKAAIETYLNQDVIGFFWKQSEKLWSSVNRFFAQHNVPAKLEGFWPCPQWVFDEPLKPADFFRACYRNGLSLYNVSYINFSHRDADVDDALQRFERVAGSI